MTKRAVILLTALFGSPAVFPASTVSYDAGRRVDSINLDLRISAVQRQDDGALKIIAAGTFDNRDVELALRIDHKWEPWPSAPKSSHVQRFNVRFLSTGDKSAALDDIARRYFHRKQTQSLFAKEGYQAATDATNEDIQKRRVEFGAGDFGLDREFDCYCLFGLDVPNRSLKLSIFEVAYGRSYPTDRIR